MNNKRIVITLMIGLLLLGSFSNAHPGGGHVPHATPDPTNITSSLDKNLCITVFGIVSLAFVIYLFKKKSFKIAENESTFTTATTKRSHDFNVLN